LFIDYYKDFYVEKEKNTQTLTSWIIDTIKSALFLAILGPILLFVLLGIIHMSGEMFYFWLVLAYFSYIMIFKLLSSLMPSIFNNFEKLEKGNELYEDLDHLAINLNFPQNSVEIIDTSTRSSEANAYITGYGSNVRIVLSDNLLEQHLGLLNPKEDGKPIKLENFDFENKDGRN
jgi:STE24 endopeptidase